jgi:hypothetical protein
MLLVCERRGSRSRFCDDYLESGVAERSDVARIGSRIGDQDVEIGDRANVCEALHAEFSVTARAIRVLAAFATIFLICASAWLAVEIP